MREWNEDYDENPDEFQEENPDEVLNEELQEEFPQEKILEERGIPREWWTESMWKIDNSEILEREIEGAEKLIEKDNVIENKLESGEFSKSRYDHEKLVVLGREKADFSARCDLESEDITFDKLGDLAEDAEFTIAEAAGNKKPAEMKEGVKKLIRQEGPDYAQDLADRERDKEELKDESYKSISRQVRLHGK